MASTDGEVAVAGFFQLLLASAPFVAAVGTTGGVVKVYRDVIPQGIIKPAVVLSKSGFRPQIRPIQQGGTLTQLWSRGTVTASIAVDGKYSANLVRLLLNALDNVAELTVPSLGYVFWIRHTDDNDEPVQLGEMAFKLTRINFDVAAKAT